MCVDESFLWLYVYCEVWYDEKHVPCITMGRSECLLFAICQHFHLHPGGAENENLDLVECLGIIGDACRMDVMVGAKRKKVFTLSHIKFLAGL